MIENTIENKAKFFALYLNRKKCIIRQGYINRDNIKPNGVDEYDSLELKSLSSITDEDAIAVAKLNRRINWNIGSNPKIWKNLFGHTVVSNGEGYGSIYARTIVTIMDYLSLEQCDFLRSSGYLLPWMGLTPNEIIGYGWAKCKEL